MEISIRLVKPDGTVSYQSISVELTCKIDAVIGEIEALYKKEGITIEREQLQKLELIHAPRRFDLMTRMHLTLDTFGCSMGDSIEIELKPTIVPQEIRILKSIRRALLSTVIENLKEGKPVLVGVASYAHKSSNLYRQQYPNGWLLPADRTKPKHIVLIDRAYAGYDAADTVPQLFEYKPWVFIESECHHLVRKFYNTETHDTMSVFGCNLSSAEIAYYMQERDDWACRLKKYPQQLMCLSLQTLALIARDARTSLVIGNFYDKSALPIFDSRFDSRFDLNMASSAFEPYDKRLSRYVVSGMTPDELPTEVEELGVPVAGKA